MSNENFTSWLIILNAALPPVGAIIILDYCRHRKNYVEAPQDEAVVKSAAMAVNPGAVAGVIARALVSIFVPYGIASFNSMAVACVVDLLYEKRKRSKQA